MIQTISAPRRCVKLQSLDDAQQSHSRQPIHIRASLHHARSDTESGIRRIPCPSQHVGSGDRTLTRCFFAEYIVAHAE